MKNIYIVLALILFLTVGCIDGGGSGGDKTDNPAPTGTPGTVSLISSTPSIFFGLNNFSTPKSKSFTIQNTGTKQSRPIGVTNSGSEEISIDTSGCLGKKINPNESCTINVVFNDNIRSCFLSSSCGGLSFKKTITISDGPRTVVIPLYGYSYNFNEIDYMIEAIISKQSLSTSGGLYKGEWRFNANVNHLSSNAVIIDALISAKDLYQGLKRSDGVTTLYTQNINFNTTPDSSWKALDKSLFFMAINDKNTLTYADDSFIKFDPNEAGTEADISFTKWTNSEYSKPKTLSTSIIEIINNNYKLIYGTNLSNYSTLINTYLDSRKILTIDGSNTITGTASNISAQISYLLNPNRIASSRYIENSFKDINFYFDYFKSINDTTSLNKIAKHYIERWQYDLVELQETPSVFFPSLNLKYNTNEFDYTSFTKPGSNLTGNPPMITDKLWWLIDYSSYYINSHSCRDSAYALLNLVNSYKLAQLTDSEKQSAELLIQDGILNLKNLLACSYDDSLKKYLSQNNVNGTFNQNNGLPLILRIYHRLPDSLLSVDAKIKMYDQIIEELSSGGSLDLDDDTTNPLYLSESLKTLIELKDQ